MDIEQEQILSKASNYWENSFRRKFENEAGSTLQTDYEHKDIIERIFSSSASFWNSLFGNPQSQSRKMSDEGIPYQKQEEDEFNLFVKEPEPVQNLDNVSPESQPLYENPVVNQTDNYYLGYPQFQEQDMNWDHIPELNPKPSLDSEQSYHLQNSSDSKIRIRRTNSLQALPKRKPFTPQEDKIIIELIQNYGRNFTLITQHLPGRTEQMVRNRFKSKIRKQLKIDKIDYDHKKQNARTISNLAQSERNSQQDLSQFQNLLKTQISITNLNLQQPKTNLEKFRQIKRLQDEIQQIESMLQNTKSEIIREYFSMIMKSQHLQN